MRFVEWLYLLGALLAGLAPLTGCVGSEGRYRVVQGPASVHMILATPWGSQTFSVEIKEQGRVWFGPDYDAFYLDVTDLETPQVEPDAEPDAEPEAGPDPEPAAPTP